MSLIEMSPDLSLRKLRRYLADSLSKITEYAEREADIILLELTGLDRAAVMFDETVADDYIVKKASSILEKRLERIPLQYILGKAYFRRLELQVGEGVLIPRPETEILVDFVLDEVRRIKKIRGDRMPVRVLDIGTGSGAIAAAIADESDCSEVMIEAVDISEKALAVAEENLKKYRNVRLYQSDLFDQVQGCLDVICSNPPYIAERERDELMPEVLREPELALFAEEDGLRIYRRILMHLQDYMNEYTSVIFEIGATQYDEVEKLFFEILKRTDVEPVYDYSGRRRFICMKNLK
ncbi:MAG: peptide chain release factor N(5)-glutamine methyltransferase [Bacillota bacterium]|nr:peptide chain release factor N(5)-glutamine methyltransferase [Bacillota bacterium]